ncbi:MAG: hypothetical protein LBR30_04545, partial [Clostridioides sp.]|nr:hypothetical protein [Clostridioides sp.]
MTKRTKVIEGNTRYFTKEDQDWWNYKVYNPVEEPEEGKGIEEYFTSLDNHITTPEEFISEKKSVISFAGDIMPIPIYEEGIADHLFDEIEDYYFDADLAVANLESPLTPSQKARYDVFP